jgi:hypothetical protein
MIRHHATTHCLHLSTVRLGNRRQVCPNVFAPVYGVYGVYTIKYILYTHAPDIKDFHAHMHMMRQISFLGVDTVDTVDRRYFTSGNLSTLSWTSVDNPGNFAYKA